jgi:hypothetical protein
VHPSKQTPQEVIETRHSGNPPELDVTCSVGQLFVSVLGALLKPFPRLSWCYSLCVPSFWEISEFCESRIFVHHVVQTCKLWTSAFGTGFSKNLPSAIREIVGHIGDPLRIFLYRLRDEDLRVRLVSKLPTRKPLRILSGRLPKPLIERCPRCIRLQ